jgi:hypothetical protein
MEGETTGTETGILTEGIKMIDGSSLIPIEMFMNADDRQRHRELRGIAVPQSTQQPTTVNKKRKVDSLVLADLMSASKSIVIQDGRKKASELTDVWLEKRAKEEKQRFDVLVSQRFSLTDAYQQAFTKSHELYNTFQKVGEQNPLEWVSMLFTFIESNALTEELRTLLITALSAKARLVGMDDEIRKVEGFLLEDKQEIENRMRVKTESLLKAKLDQLNTNDEV